MKEPKIRFIKSSSFLRKQLKDIAIINPKCSLPEIFEYVDLESVIGTEMKNHRTEKKGSAPSRAQRLAQKGDIFFQTVRPYQQNNYYFDLDANNFVFSTGYAQICSKVNPKYLFTILQQSSFLDQVLENCTGTSYPAIAPSALSNLYLNVCVDPNEQNLIASYFQSLDTLIQATSKQLASLKQIKAASLQSMFPQEGETKPRVRFKGFEGEWKKPLISEVFNLRNGYTPSKFVDDYWEEGTIPWFRMEDIRAKGGILFDSIQHITPQAVKGELFKPFSIILATTATIGVHAMLIVDSLANQQFTNFSICESLLREYDPYYVYYAFYKIDEWSLHNTNSGGLLSVDIKGLMKQPFYTPLLPEQQKIASYFLNLDRQITLQTRRLEKLKQIKAACLDKMFV